MKESKKVLPAALQGPGDTPTAIEPYNLSLTDALALLQHLNGKGLLCTACGYREAEYANMMHSHCEACKRPSMEYSNTRKGSKFERSLCASLRRFVEINFEV